MIRHGFLIAISCLLVINAAAQVSGDPLARMNDVKRDTTYLYGIGNMRTEAEAREEALLALSDILAPYLKESGYTFLKDVPSIPEGIIQFVLYSKRPGQFRAMAYASKTKLAELELQQTEIFEETGKDAIEALKENLLHVSTRAEAERLIVDSGQGEYVHSGLVAPDSRQTDVDDGFLFFFDRKTGKILEIMTPCDESGNRKDARTGASTTAMKYKHTSILWIRFEGQNHK